MQVRPTELNALGFYSAQPEDIENECKDLLETYASFGNHLDGSAETFAVNFHRVEHC